MESRRRPCRACRHDSRNAAGSGSTLNILSGPRLAAGSCRPLQLAFAGPAPEPRAVVSSTGVCTDALSIADCCQCLRQAWKTLCMLAPRRCCGAGCRSAREIWRRLNKIRCGGQRSARLTSVCQSLVVRFRFAERQLDRWLGLANAGFLTSRFPTRNPPRQGPRRIAAVRGHCRSGGRRPGRQRA